MSLQDELPGAVVALLRSASVSQYSTVSAAGAPIDTPVLIFPGHGLRSIDLATGLSYPAKAERARNNPKVGLFIEGGPGEPAVSIAGMAAVRDRDLQANVDRYLSEASYTLPGDPDWSLARQAVWYWTRIIVEVTPARVLWWEDAADMTGPPRRWNAPADTVFPVSDPAPRGSLSKAAQWRQPEWRELAQQALHKGDLAHLTTIDSDGFPLPLRVRVMEVTGSGFALETPAGAPWPLTGKACLTFQGIETFVGEASANGGLASMRVERTLPVFPMTEDMRQLWEPAPDTRTQLMARLRHETERRGQAIPAIPTERPLPSEGYKLRMARFQATAS